MDNYSRSISEGGREAPISQGQLFETEEKRMSDRTYRLVMAVMSALVVVAAAVVGVILLINECAESVKGYC